MDELSLGYPFVKTSAADLSRSFFSQNMKYLFSQNFTMKHYHIISRVAIYLLSVVLIAFGIFHFMYPRDLLVYVPPSLIGGIKWAYVVGGLSSW